MLLSSKNDDDDDEQLMLLLQLLFLLVVVQMPWTKAFFWGVFQKWCKVFGAFPFQLSYKSGSNGIQQSLTVYRCLQLKYLDLVKQSCFTTNVDILRVEKWRLALPCSSELINELINSCTNRTDQPVAKRFVSCGVLEAIGRSNVDGYQTDTHQFVNVKSIETHNKYSKAKRQRAKNVAVCEASLSFWLSLFRHVSASLWRRKDCYSGPTFRAGVRPEGNF